MSAANHGQRSAAGRKLQVGAWLVDPASNEVRRGADAVRLEPKAMNLLVALAERAGTVVSREELLSVVWPGVVVSDEVLTQGVIKLRKALGDTARESEYIETISKRGYRLIAAVRRAADSPTGNAAGGPAVVPAAGGRRRIAAVAAIAALVAFAAGLAVWFAERSRDADVDAPGAALETLRPGSRPMVVIRPFAAVGDDAQAALFAQGLTADLVADLSKVSGLWVAMESAVADPAGRQLAAETAAAQYVLSGTVQRGGDRLRVQVQLAESATGRQLWSERTERSSSDLFAVQDEIARGLLAALPVKVKEAELARLARRYTRNLQAYEYFLRAQSAVVARRQAENDLAREMYLKAIELDPAFARAYAGLALTYAADHRNRWTKDGAAAVSRAFELAETARAIDPDLPETYWVLAYVHVSRKQHAAALQQLRVALRLNPSYADALAFIGGIHTYLGRPAETLPALRAAMRLNPDAGSLYFMILGRAYYFVGDMEQARMNLSYALSRNAANLESRAYLAAVLVRLGEREAAAWEVEEIRALEPGFKAREWLDAEPMVDVAQRDQLLKDLGTLGL
jgi:DNA-binding winged helix-turn-helix (wHTH) protein/TolB-like protein/Tfp pilus assembly protein PilF